MSSHDRDSEGLDSFPLWLEACAGIVLDYHIACGADGVTPGDLCAAYEPRVTAFGRRFGPAAEHYLRERLTRADYFFYRRSA